MRAAATLVVTLAFATNVSAIDQPYGWTISASSTDPFVNTAVPTFGINTFYLWLVCCDVPDYPNGTPRQQGFSGAEFALIPTGVQHLATAPACFLTDPPPPPDILLFCPGCPCGPVLLASLLVLDLPGSICFAPSVLNGVLGTVDCEPQPTLWGMDWIGIDTTGAGAPCSSGMPCAGPVSVEGPGVSGSSWGRVKSVYR